jgi:hypothetical protein
MSVSPHVSSQKLGIGGLHWKLRDRLYFASYWFNITLPYKKLEWPKLKQAVIEVVSSNTGDICCHCYYGNLGPSYQSLTASNASHNSLHWHRHRFLLCYSYMSFARCQWVICKLCLIKDMVLFKGLACSKAENSDTIPQTVVQ